MSEPLFSIIIPSLNEEKYIGNILESLSKQSYKDFEVIVVDASSTDKTPQIINSFKKNYPARTINSKIKNLSHQRNLGAREARGKYLFFIDADNSIPNDFLEKTEKYFEDENVDAIIPRVVPENDTLMNQISYVVALILLSILLHTSRAYSTGGNLVIKKDIFKKTKGFDEAVFVGEDHDMVRQLKEMKVKMKIMMESYVVFSMRRFEKEGIPTYLKYSYAFVYQLFFRKVNRTLYNYKMGGDNYK